MDYFRKTPLPLKTTTNKLFSIRENQLDPLKDELEKFLDGQQHMNNRLFSKDVLFTHELKANNTVEGFNDDVTIIEKVIEDAKQVGNPEIKNRIINLYNGYNYILDGLEINEETVAELYKILSQGLLSERDLANMGEKYREAPVYILNGGRLDSSMDHGIDAKLISEYMKSYFEFVNSSDNFSSQTDYFLKSQIMHFYFVYIHPYFDINGRTSRTIAMWYLLNNQAYPYIIFNRGINFDANYDRIIRNCKLTYDITKFLKYMLVTVKKELEKEYIMHHMGQFVDRTWTSVDYQTLEHFLSVNRQERTILDHIVLYNRFNSKKRNQEIFESMILPLIDDGTLTVTRETSKNMFNDQKNMVLELNRKRLDEIDCSDVTRIRL